MLICIVFHSTNNRIYNSERAFIKDWLTALYRSSMNPIIISKKHRGKLELKLTHLGSYVQSVKED